MKNITLSINPDTVKKVRKIALERDTSLAAMVRDFLEQVAATEDTRGDLAIQDLERSFHKLSRRVGKQDWSRDDLHER
ncbi:MAG: CopG family transcriptional regulator [Verrucomicrobia bacterium]|jgi:hypothetical protein|nr:CopG family transcriptional regulator [Verrucomicrobiota bacterium]MDA7510106.1 DUF6364 family protein [Verrucomicrobiota bacterium]MDB4796641.1 DUF6364 family protein [bacterium]